MPLSEPAPRRAIHCRQVTCQGFQRDDGLWDIEGRLVDTKTYEFTNRDRGAIPPGTPIHEMVVRVTVDDELVIRQIEAVTLHAPFAICGDITPAFSALAGMSLTNGFLREVRARFGGVKGCTHIVELMAPIATTAYQTIAPLRHLKTREGRDNLLDSCHALAADGPVMAREFSRGNG